MDEATKKAIEELGQKIEQISNEIFVQHQLIAEGLRTTDIDKVVKADDELNRLHVQKEELVRKKQQMLASSGHEQFIREHLGASSQKGDSWRQGSFENQM